MTPTVKKGKENTLDLPPTEPMEKTIADEPEPESVAVNDMDDFEFVRMPNGELRAVPKGQIRDVPLTSTQDASRQEVAKPKEEDHFYVHLSDGSVERVKESDVPKHAGMSAPHGFWQRDGKLYQVTAVYPVEVEVKE